MYLLSAYILAAGTWAIAADFGAAKGLPLTINGVFVGDKVLHFLVVGGFALVLSRAIRLLGGRPVRSLLIGMAIAAVLATLEEFTNALTPHRNFSTLDMLANYSGILAMGLVGRVTMFRRPAANGVAGEVIEAAASLVGGQAPQVAA